MTTSEYKDVEFRRNLVGEFLKESRKKAGLTQLDVARSLNYSSAQFVSNWERGIALPPLDVLPELCNIYTIDRDDLFRIFVDYQQKVFEHRENQLRKFLLSSHK